MKYTTLGLVLAAAVMAASLLAGCNTMAGFGTDVQHAGQGIHNSAEQHKNNND
jgi:predicted small secreted protein